MGPGRAPAIVGLEVAALALLLVLPALLSDFHVFFMTRTLMFVLLALGFDLTWGYGGIFSLGQAVFFGAGAYVAGLLATRQDITSVFVTIPAATLAGLVLSLLLAGFLFLGRRRVSVIYISLATLAASYAFERLAAAWTEIGAANGIPSVPVLTAGDTRLLPGQTFYYLALLVVVLVYLLFRSVVGSQFGLALVAGRTDLQRVTYLGYHTAGAQLLVFGLAGAVSGMAGGFYAFHEGFVSPSLLGVMLSTQVVLWALFGGVGTLIGAVVGVIAIEAVGLQLADRLPEYWPIILGAILLVGITFLPNGILGLVVPDRARVMRFGRGGTTEPGPGEADAHGEAVA